MIIELIFFFLVAFMVSYLVRHYVFTFVTLYHRRKQPGYILNSTVYQPKVSVLIPARNEEKVIRRILQRMTELTYPRQKLEVIVIDDASTDRTGEIAEEFAERYDCIKVIHRNAEDGGKGKSGVLNEGLSHTKGEIVYFFDADYYPQRDILEKLTAYFADPKVGAVQGRVTVLNEPHTLVTRLVTLERIGGYRIDQQARDSLGLIPQFGGTQGGFRRQLIESLGGFNPKMLTEDTDMTFRVYLAGYKVRYANEAECYEEAVENWHSYWRQRYRWAKGHMQCAFKHLWPFIKCKNLRLREKVDGLLLLNIYFVPVLIWLAWIIGIILYFSSHSPWFTFLLASMPLYAYSAVGNFAPFFEIGIGVYLDRRARVCRLIPLLFVTFLYNTLICTKAFIDLCISKIMGKEQHAWLKTIHCGRGNNHIRDLNDNGQ